VALQHRFVDLCSLLRRDPKWVHVRHHSLRRNHRESPPRGAIPQTNDKPHIKEEDIYRLVVTPLRGCLLLRSIKRQFHKFFSAAFFMSSWPICHQRSWTFRTRIFSRLSLAPKEDQAVEV
jgi:hypothetical protein